MFLLDTNVVSEIRKGQKMDARVSAWSSQQSPATLFLSVITVMELRMGILAKARKDKEQGQRLENWMNRHVLPAFFGRILPVDLAIANQCAVLHVPDPRSDRDALIAATALVHGLAVVTRNVQDFVPTGVPVINPWN